MTFCETSHILNLNKNQEIVIVMQPNPPENLPQKIRNSKNTPVQ